MLFQKEISEAFERNALEYLGKDFEKHKNYLLNVAFGRNSSLIPQQEFDDAISIYRTNPRKCAKELFKALSPAIEKTMETIYTRGLSLKTKHDNGSLSVDDNGGEQIEVQSERSSNKTYTVNLISLECSCPYFKKVKFAGMLCKHIFLANELLGDKYRTAQPVSPRPQPDSDTSAEKLDIQSTDTHFSYGSQRLSKRPRRGNSLIPSDITYILEGTPPEMVVYTFESGESLLMVGESGVGKSKMIQYLAQETNTPLLNACGHNEITVENLLGTMTVVNGNTIWKDGILPEAMRRGYWMLLDEINSIDPGVMKVINELLDNRRITITVAGEPRMVKAHRDFRFVCTMNPPDSPIYKGIEMMSFELMDRFDTVVYLDYLSPETESKLIMDMTGFSDEVTARKMVQFAGSIRQAMKQGEIFATVTTRSLISFCRKAQVFDIRTSADTAILRKMSAADRDKASDIFNAIFK
ncbi:AAA family ATPase [Candidatus Poribacteria bacterium]